MRILVCEDEKDLNRLICNTLIRAGYSVDYCYNGEDALDYVANADYDCILLDVMMPKLDGYGVLKYLRQNNKNFPVIFLTAKDAIEDRITGLDLGADDYLVKPFDFNELLARIRAATRKYGTQKTSVYSLADLSVDTATHIVKRANQEIKLSAKEYSILEYLIMHKETIVTRNQLENHIWNYDYVGGSNVVDVYITYLRRKIDNNFENKLLHTIRGTGWILKESQ